VEVLVVILIVGMLAGLLAPAVMRALASARNAAIKAEIDMLHMAMMNYKNEYGSFPPALLGATNTALDPQRIAVRTYLRRLFPRVNPVTLCLPGDSPLLTQDQLSESQMNVIPIAPGAFAESFERSLVFWLNGFTETPLSPLGPPQARQRLFQFDQGRLVPDPANPFNIHYHVSRKPNARFQYIDNRNYGNLALIPTPAQFASPTPMPPFVHVYPDRVLTNGNERLVPTWVDSLPQGRRELWFFTVSTDENERRHQRPFNADSFQILNAGQDEVFGTDDDLSDFWPGTRREYLDSLKAR
jgi:type II secretory pathway pseudopilin PulG